MDLILNIQIINHKKYKYQNENIFLHNTLIGVYKYYRHLHTIIYSISNHRFIMKKTQLFIYIVIKTRNWFSGLTK